MQTIKSSSGQVLDSAALLHALQAFGRGDLSVRMPLDLSGIDADIARAFNDAVKMSKSRAEQARQHFVQMRDVEMKNREVEQARSALEEKARQLALSSRYKSEFLANMSHELRTPLNCVLILAGLLAANKDRNLTPKQIEFAQAIHSSGADLLSLIDEILNLAKIESGTVTVKIAREPLAGLRDYFERTFRQTASMKHLEFSVSGGGDLAIDTDIKRLHQIIRNLLSNAFKFTDYGAVSLHIAAVTSGWSAGQAVLERARQVVAFTVSDTGIGVPEDKQKIIFEAFQQADGSTSREYAGTGLGLSISRELARLLGGEIVLASTPGLGSAFTLYLPASYLAAPGNGSPAGALFRRSEPHDAKALRSPMAVAGSTAASAAPLGKLAGRRILLVDDEPRNALALASALEQRGLVMSHVESGKEAIEALTHEPAVDALLMDVMMPRLDGYDAIRIIRRMANGKFASLPIIAVTARAMAGDREKCLQAGATDYVSKPVNIDALLMVLARQIGA